MMKDRGLHLGILLLLAIAGAMAYYFLCAGVPYLEIFICRIPVFLCGIIMAYYMGENSEISVFDVIISGIISILCICIYNGIMGDGPSFLLRMCVSLFALSLLVWMPVVFDRMPGRVISVLDFLGKISLEIYLIHLYVVNKMLQYNYNYFVNLIIVLVVTIPVAYIVHMGMSRVLEKCR